MQLLYHSLAFYLLLAPPTAAAASASAATTAKASPTPQPCTIRSPLSHAFFDLNPLHIEAPALPTSGKTKPSKNARHHSWNATGWGLGYNFTLNFCGAVVEDLKAAGGVVGVEEALWGNVSAYYRQGGEVFSMGQQNSVPVLHGRKLVMNYTNGSPCDSPASMSRREILDPDDDDKPKKRPSKSHGDDDDDNDEDDPKKFPKKPSPPTRRKSTIISLLCDRDPLSPLLTLSFIAASPDQCTYFFEARSSAGCAGLEVATQTLSPAGVFGVIVFIAIIVYVVGGCVYSRMVLQQRGWRQLPNYGLWAGVFGFFRDIVVILTSSCARCLPSRRGYSRVNGGIGGSGAGGGRGRGRGDSDAENRLIDELNEEWDD
ncbi:hypothetical protein LTR08_005249 [Meristemomyces frigidus]|nr:hypothetical protein LTR08_005249 [Meristemomyces frigidus]